MSTQDTGSATAPAKKTFQVPASSTRAKVCTHLIIRSSRSSPKHLLTPEFQISVSPQPVLGPWARLAGSAQDELSSFQVIECNRSHCTRAGPAGASLRHTTHAATRNTLSSRHARNCASRAGSRPMKRRCCLAGISIEFNAAARAPAPPRGHAAPLGRSRRAQSSIPRIRQG